MVNALQPTPTTQHLILVHISHLRRHRLSDAYEDICCLSDAYETSRPLCDAYGHIFKKKKIIFVIFGRFKKRHLRAVGFWIEM